MRPSLGNIFVLAVSSVDFCSLPRGAKGHISLIFFYGQVAARLKHLIEEADPFPV